MRQCHLIILPTQLNQVLPVHQSDPSDQFHPVTLCRLEVLKFQGGLSHLQHLKLLKIQLDRCHLLYLWIHVVPQVPLIQMHQ